MYRLTSNNVQPTRTPGEEEEEEEVEKGLGGVTPRDQGVPTPKTRKFWKFFVFKMNFLLLIGTGGDVPRPAGFYFCFFGGSQ